MTGESFPVTKQASTVSDADTTLAERVNMVYMGATVVAGTGRAVVTGTGADSELGRVGTLVAAVKEEKTPLERRLDALGHRLVWSLGVAGLVGPLPVPRAPSDRCRAE